MTVQLIDWYAANRTRSRALFELVDEDAYYARPISLRQPIVFYEGHLPAFSFNTLVRRGLGGPSIDARLESLFARGIDPHESAGSAASEGDERASWPSRSEVRQFAEEADRRVVDALEGANREAAFTILEHEAMHQETLLYMWHQLPLGTLRRPAGHVPNTSGAPPAQQWIDVPAGRATLGVDAGTRPFTWDNERGAFVVDVPAFSIERHDVTNAAFLEFVNAGGYDTGRWWQPEDWAWARSEKRTHPQFWQLRDDQWFQRGMFDEVPLPLSWPVYVTYAEASAFARWRGRRLPTEREFQRAAYGTPSGIERPFPWGDDAPTAERGVFDFVSWDPQPAGSHPAGQSAWGVDDLVGNGWEWTSSVFEPFEGFVASHWYPEYSADFFDGAHMVMKGASPVTARELIRSTFRNWFRPRYPFVYATFRCAADR